MERCKKTELKIRKSIINHLLQVHCCWLSYCAPAGMLIRYNVAFFQSFCVPGTNEKRALNPTHSVYFIASFRVSSTWNIIYRCKYNGCIELFSMKNEYEVDVSLIWRIWCFFCYSYMEDELRLHIYVSVKSC